MLFLESLYKTIYSPSFYKKASLKGIKKSLFVFIGFAVLITIISSVVFFFQSTKVINDLPDFTANFPNINISSDGVLTLTNLSEPMPLVFIQDNYYIGIDTTGELTSIPSIHTQGILITATEITIKDPSSPSGVVTATFTDLLESLERSEINISGADVTKWVESFLNVAKFAYPFLAFGWFLFARLFGLLFVALFVWMFFSVAKIKYPARNAFIATMYASIPVFYVGYILSLLNKGLTSLIDVDLMNSCCLIGLLLALIQWGIFIGIAYMGLSEKSEEDVASEAQPI
jgi:hypothetical protein